MKQGLVTKQTCVSCDRISTDQAAFRTFNSDGVLQNRTHLWRWTGSSSEASPENFTDRSLYSSQLINFEKSDANFCTSGMGEVSSAEAMPKSATFSSCIESVPDGSSLSTSIGDSGTLASFKRKALVKTGGPHLPTQVQPSARAGRLFVKFRRQKFTGSFTTRLLKQTTILTSIPTSNARFSRSLKVSHKREPVKRSNALNPTNWQFQQRVQSVDRTHCIQNECSGNSRTKQEAVFSKQCFDNPGLFILIFFTIFTKWSRLVIEAKESVSVSKSPSNYHQNLQLLRLFCDP